MTRIKMHMLKMKLPFYPPYKVKYELQNRVSTIVNIFIVFVKFLGWIVAIWMKLVRLIEEKGDLRFWKGSNYKN